MSELGVTRFLALSSDGGWTNETRTPPFSRVQRLADPVESKPPLLFQARLSRSSTEHFAGHLFFIFLGASSFLLPACAFDKLRL